MTSRTARRWVADGRLHRLLRGVYAVGHLSPAPEQRWQAALLAYGDDAVLSRRVALALPAASLNRQFGPYTLDAVWPGARLIVEIDTYETHGTRHSFETDRERDAYLLEGGLRTMRVTPRQWRSDSDRLERRLRRQLAADLGE